MPVIFGPNYHNFREAVEMEKAGGAFSSTAVQTLQSARFNVRFIPLRLADTSAVAKEFVAKIVEPPTHRERLVPLM